MSMNDEVHFSQLPRIGIERSRIDRSHGHKLSANVGQLIPIYCEEVLPGTTVTMDTSKIIRFQTMQTPIMDDIFADISWWFVPDRLCWTHFKEFMGENTASAWIPSVTYTKPVLKVYDPRYTGLGTDNFNRVGTLLDYMGYPVGVNYVASNSYQEIDASPFRAYALIVNDFWRDQNLSDPLVINLGDSATDAVALSGDTYIQTVAKGGEPFVACKTFDYFTSCLPSPQKGPAVTLPLGSKAPVYTGVQHYAGDTAMRFNPVSGYTFTNGTAYNVVMRADSNDSAYLDPVTSSYASGTLVGAAPNNLWADLTNATAATIADIRMAFQLQKFYERLARSGSRYQEIIAGFFDVEAQDARLQRPEYLGGNRFPINVEQVANSAQTSSDALGDVGAFSRTTDLHSDFTKSFVEHGWLIGLMVLRYNHTYCQGIPKKFTRFNRLDHYFPTFAHISEQPVDSLEIYVGDYKSTFGYNEAWSSYRYSQNTCAAEMRPYVSGSLGAWHLADDYAAKPTLSDGWIREDKTNVDRVLTVTSSAANQYWADFYFKTYWTVPMPLYSVPGLVDHF